MKSAKSAEGAGVNLGLLVFNGLIIALMYALSKTIMAHGVAPATVILWQVVPSAVVVFGVASALGQRPSFTPDLLRYYLTAGLLGLTLPYTITYEALQHLPTGVVGVAGSLSAVMTYAFARIAGMERPNIKKFSGLLLGMAGVLAIVLPKGALPAPDMTAWVVIALLAPLSLAAANVYRTSHWPANGKPLSMAAGMLLTQSLVATALTMTTGSEWLPPAESYGVCMALAAVGLLSSLFYLTAFELQQRAEPVFVSQLGYVISLGSLLIGFTVFGERPSVWIWIAVFAIVAGLALVTRKPTT